VNYKIIRTVCELKKHVLPIIPATEEAETGGLPFEAGQGLSEKQAEHGSAHLWSQVLLRLR
jgi:hypothetical protein